MSVGEHTYIDFEVLEFFQFKISGGNFEFSDFWQIKTTLGK